MPASGLSPGRSIADRSWPSSRRAIASNLFFVPRPVSRAETQPSLVRRRMAARFAPAIAARNSPTARIHLRELTFEKEPQGLSPHPRVDCTLTFDTVAGGRTLQCVRDCRLEGDRVPLSSKSNATPWIRGGCRTIEFADMSPAQHGPLAAVRRRATCAGSTARASRPTANWRSAPPGLQHTERRGSAADSGGRSTER